MTTKLRPYRIAVVIPKYGLVGGAEGFAAELTEQLARRPDFEIHVFANRWVPSSARIAFHHVPILRFPKLFTTPSFAILAGQKIKAMKFDLIHTHDRICRADLYTLHGIPHRLWIEEVRKKRFLSLYDRATVAVERHLVRQGNCRFFLAVSSMTRDFFLREYPMDPQCVPIVHPGISFPSAAGDVPSRSDIRESLYLRFGIPASAPLLLFASMNFDIKGLDAVLAGIGHWRQRNPRGNAKLLVIGKGAIVKYQRLAALLGISDMVHFAGPMPREQLMQTYVAANGYIMLSKFDTFGLVVLEAMAAGLPVLISGNVGAKDLIREGINGFVVPDAADASAVADRIDTLLNPEIRPAMSAEAIRTAAAQTWERTAIEVETVYRRLLSEKRTRVRIE